MQTKTAQDKKKPLEEKIKFLPVEHQHYVKGLIDGVLMSKTKKGATMVKGGQAV